MPVQMDRARIDELKAKLPERPFDKQRRFEADFGLPYSVTTVLCPNRELSEFFEAALETHNSPKLIANYVANDLLRDLPEPSNTASRPRRKRNEADSGAHRHAREDDRRRHHLQADRQGSASTRCSRPARCPM